MSTDLETPNSSLWREWDGILPRNVRGTALLVMTPQNTTPEMGCLVPLLLKWIAKYPALKETVCTTFQGNKVLRSRGWSL